MEQANPPAEVAASGIDSAQTASLPLPALSAPRFCTGCGSVWQAGWVECPVCAHRRNAALSGIGSARDRSRIGPALWLYFTLLAASVAGIIAGMAGVGAASLLIGLSAVHTTIFAAWSLWARRDVVPALLKPFSPTWIPLSIAAGCATFILAMISLNLLHRFLGVQRLDPDTALYARGGSLLVVALTCVQPAIFEELGFRGVILSALQPTLAPMEAVIVSALLFMTLHLTFGSCPHLLIMGLVLGFLRVRTGSLLPGMLMHFTHNLLCVLLEQRWS